MFQPVPRLGPSSEDDIDGIDTGPLLPELHGGHWHWSTPRPTTARTTSGWASRTASSRWGSSSILITSLMSYNDLGVQEEEGESVVADDGS